MKAIEQEHKLLDRYKDVLNFQELEEILRTKRTKTYQLLRNKTIPSFKIGTDYRIFKASVINYFNQILEQ